MMEMHDFYFPTVDAKPQCVTDSDCDIDKQCYQGSCRLACSIISCGLNAVCAPQFHNGVCECLNGYQGNPTIACKKGKFGFLFFCFVYDCNLSINS